MYEGNNYYYVKKCLGDVIAVVDSDYKDLCTYEYDARGNIKAITGDKDIASLNPYRYRSYYYDEDIGLYYLRSRYYDSRIGRFLNMDAEIEMLRNENNYNLYAYCNNNWVNYTDAHGKVKGYIISLINDVDEYGNSSDRFFTESEVIKKDIKEAYKKT